MCSATAFNFRVKKGIDESLDAWSIHGIGGAWGVWLLVYIIAKLIDAAIGLRVSEAEEYVGLDISQHGEVAYC